ncbi:MAG: cobaltochelatase subunit CobN [Deltaproteobacteria bacterium]|jgi:cobaltochelatase CobN|nr:cobaltochelatase subunit CobN [Deltaproteobacteria bacterium]
MSRILTALFATALLAVATLVSGPAAEALAAEGRISLLTTDPDSYLAAAAMTDLPLPDGLEARSFCLRDLTEDEEAAAFLADSRLILVDVMDSRLTGQVIDRGLLDGRTVFGLRRSQDDEALTKDGFLLNAELTEYYDNRDKKNIANMILRAVNLAIDGSVAYEAVVARPRNGLYHPEAPTLMETMEEYLTWIEARPGFDASAPWLGLMFFPSYLAEGQKESLDELIIRLERAGFNTLPSFGRDQEMIEQFFLDDGGRARVDAVLSFSLKFHSALMSGLADKLREMDVPIFGAVSLYAQTIDEWRASEQGIPPVEVFRSLAVPEISGVVEPSPLAGRVTEKGPNGGLVQRYVLIDEQVDRLIGRIRSWINLRRLPNEEKKIAIFYYNNSQGKQKIGASYLNVFRSIEEIVARMAQAGYALPTDLTLDEETIQGLVLRGGRNIGSWAPGELDDLIASGQTEMLPIPEYEKWFATLPEDFRNKVIEQWGEPEDGGPMIKDGFIVIPLVRAGNVILLPEPARGMSDDPMKLVHDPLLYPHHQYIAVYLWIKRVFKADAMVHLGTHATHEWLPGKQAGLSASDAPEVLVNDIPNVYPYIMDNVAEGLQAKRRGRAVIVDHLVPLLTPAEGYKEYAELKETIKRYEQAKTTGAATRESHFEEIRTIALRLGLNKDLGLDMDREEDVEAVAVYLEYLETDLVPYGLHTFGRSPSGEGLEATVKAIAARTDDLSEKEVRTGLAVSGPEEMKHFLSALSGRYIPAAEGNDPVRNPAALPTGRNFYGVSPSRLPTKAAWDLGRKAADDIIRKHVESNGAFPRKVAIVLWAVESIRNEGVNEATVMALVGVEPIWSQSGQVIGTKPVPTNFLGRPRVDVAINASGLYRDLLPDKILLLDAAIRQAAAQDDLENVIRRNDERMKTRLVESGMSEEEAGRFSRARIFSEAPGAYGNRVEAMTSSSGLWKDDSAVSDIFLEHSGYAYGAEQWGDEARSSLEANLSEVEIAVHSMSSNLFGVMDNDGRYKYLGGLALAVKNLSGQAPETLIADQRVAGEVAVESLSKVIGMEMRTRYLNPKWIEGMKEENYAGAREMSNYVEYLWGWQVTAEDSVDQSAWVQSYEVYVEDKYELDIDEFMAENNAWAWQSLVGRMLESSRKGYWDPGDEALQKLSVKYAESVISKGLACCDHTCNNPQLHQMVAGIISLPGVMSPEMAAEFQMAVEKAGQTSLEEMVAAREALLENLGDLTRAERSSSSGPESPESRFESVKGLRMERIDAPAEKTSVSSSGVEWYASLFVLLLTFIFYLGISRGGKSGIT